MSNKLIYCYNNINMCDYLTIVPLKKKSKIRLLEYKLKRKVRLG